MRRFVLPAMSVALACIVPATPAAAQDAVQDAAHPAHIHDGVCPAPGAIVARLGDVSGAFLVDGTATAGALPVGADPTAPIEASSTMVDLPLATIVGSDHSIVVHASATDMGTYLVCGNVGGNTMGQADLPIALAPVGDSGYGGVAVLRSTDPATTQVTVFLTQDTGTRPGASASPGASTPLGTTTVALDQPLQFSGYEVMVKSAALDLVLGTVQIDGTVHNTGTGALDLTAFQLDGRPTITRGTDTLRIKVVTPALVPAGTTVPISLVNTDALPDGFNLDDAVLTLGTADQHQATLPLRTGAVGTYLPTQVVRIPKGARSVRVRGQARVTIESARLIPGTCSGRPDGVVFSPVSNTELSLVLSVTIEGSAPLGAIIGSYVTVPDGTSAVGGPGTIAVYRGDTQRDITLCYRVPAPADGRYTWRVEANDRHASSKFSIPAPGTP